MSLVRIAAACSVIASQLAIADTTNPALEGITGAYVRKYCTGWTTKDTIGKRSAERTYHGISTAIDRAAGLLRGFKERLDIASQLFQQAPTLESMLNGYLFTRRIGRELVPAQVLYRALVARLCIELAPSLKCAQYDDSSKPLYVNKDALIKRFFEAEPTVEGAEEEDGAEEDVVGKWWKAHGTGDYNPQSDMDKYWTDMKIPDFISGRSKVIDVLAGVPVKAKFEQPVAVADKLCGTPMVRACRAFAMNHDSCIDPPEGVKSTLEWKALRNVMIHLHEGASDSKYNLDLELEILNEGCKKFFQEEPFEREPGYMDCYEYLRQGVLGIENDEQAWKLECDTMLRRERFVTEIIGNSASLGFVYRRLTVGDGITGIEDGDVDVLQTVREKIVRADVDEGGSVVPVYAFADRKIVVKGAPGDDGEELDAVEALGLVAVKGTEEEEGGDVGGGGTEEEGGDDGIGGVVGGVGEEGDDGGDVRVDTLGALLGEWPTFIVKNPNGHAGIQLGYGIVHCRDGDGEPRTVWANANDSESADANDSDGGGDGSADARSDVESNPNTDPAIRLRGVVFTEVVDDDNEVERMWRYVGEGMYVETELNRSGGNDGEKKNVNDLVSCIKGLKIKNLIAIYSDIKCIARYLGYYGDEGEGA